MSTQDRISPFTFLTTLRLMSTNGPADAEVWNDTITEIVNDFSRFSAEWQKIVLALDKISYGNYNTAINGMKTGIDGTNLWVDSSVNSSSLDKTYFDQSNNRPITIYEALQNLTESIADQIAQVRTDVVDASSALTTEQKNRIGANVFNSSATSSSTSLDGKSENNRLNIIQLAADLYGAGYVLNNNGGTILTNSVMAMVDALLEAHGGNWDDDIVLTHSGLAVGTQDTINSSSPGDDSFVGAPTTLEEDLDEIRTRIKTLGGTLTWTTFFTELYAGGANSLEDLLTSTAGTGTKTATNPWGYNYSDIDGLNTRLNAIATFTGQNSQVDTSPGYSSTAFVSNGNPLETAIGTLDFRLGQFLTSSGTLAIPSGLIVTGGHLHSDTTLSADQDIEVTASGAGFVTKSQDGKRWRIQVDNNGSIFTSPA